MIGERIKEARIYNGWKIKDLSDRTGMCGNTISRFEKGKRMPSFKQVVILAYYLDVSIYFLITPANKELYNILIKLERII
jgi:transcriptional regulator with XRE-family HTH domain